MSVSAKSRLWVWGAGAAIFAVSSAVVVCVIWDGWTLPGLARHLGYLAALILAGLAVACIGGLLASKVSDEDRVATLCVERLFLYGGKPFQTLDKLYRKGLDPTAAATAAAEGGRGETETQIATLIEKSKTRPLTNTDSFRLYSLWAETAHGEGLGCLVLTLSDQYAAVLGAAKLAEYQKRHPLDLDLKDGDRLRADARRLLCLLLEGWRRKHAAEAVRNRLSAITAVVTLGAAIPFLVWISFFDKPPLVIAAMFAGAIGGFVSIQQRIQRLADEDQTKLFGEGSAAGGLTLLIAPVFGAIGALVLYAMFTAGLLSGNLFPVFEPGIGSAHFIDYVRDEHADGFQSIGKLLFWCFVGGFSERFIPDAISRVAGGALKQRRVKKG